MNKESRFEEFIATSNFKHQNKYNYSKVVYVNQTTKVCIICPIHGEFYMTPHRHMIGQGCPKCSGKGLSQEEIINKANLIHENKYDYSKVIFTKMHDKVTIICPIHGEFQQTLSKHISKKQSCPKCAAIQRSTKNKLDNNVFFEKAQQILEDDNILFDFVKEFCQDAQHENRTVLNGKELDIYIPSKNIAIEYNGLRWHSELFKKDKWYHFNKTQQCNENGVKLLQVFEDEFILHREIVINKIQHILNIPTNKTKIYGRKCVISVIDTKMAQTFLNEYHIQGFSNSTVYLGAFCGDNLIAVMSFKKEDKSALKWELTRFASDYHFICCGVGGKLFEWFVKHYNPTEIKSFADRRWTLDKDDNLYTKLGFELEEELNPDYEYVLDSNPTKRVHKFNFRKQILHKKYGLPLEMTESEMVKELGYSKIWNCGLFKYTWKKQ